MKTTPVKPTLFRQLPGIPHNEKKTDLLLIILGTGLMAAATNLFFTPADLVPGGFTGLAIILKHLTRKIITGGLPVWVSNILLNVPLILFSIKTRGWRFMRRTFYAALLFSLFLFIIPERPLVEEDLFLTSVIGGAIMGLGLGYVFLGKATTGGTDTLAAILQNLIPHVSVARILPFLDGLIILLSAWIFGITVTLYAVISVVISGRIANSITSGFRNAKQALIISSRYQEISDIIISEMDRGVTCLAGTGMYTGTEKPVLLCAVSNKEIVELRNIVFEVDPKAFLILGDATEIRGEGFLKYTRDEL